MGGTLQLSNQLKSIINLFLQYTRGTGEILPPDPTISHITFTQEGCTFVEITLAGDDIFIQHFINFLKKYCPTATAHDWRVNNQFILSQKDISTILYPPMPALSSKLQHSAATIKYSNASSSLTSNQYINPVAKLPIVDNTKIFLSALLQGEKNFSGQDLSSVDPRRIDNKNLAHYGIDIQKLYFYQSTMNYELVTWLVSNPTAFNIYKFIHEFLIILPETRASKAFSPEEIMKEADYHFISDQIFLGHVTIENSYAYHSSQLSDEEIRLINTIYFLRNTENAHENPLAIYCYQRLLHSTATPNPTMIVDRSKSISDIIADAAPEKLQSFISQTNADIFISSLIYTIREKNVDAFKKLIIGMEKINYIWFRTPQLLPLIDILNELIIKEDVKNNIITQYLYHCVLSLPAYDTIPFKLPSLSQNQSSIPKMAAKTTWQTLLHGRKSNNIVNTALLFSLQEYDIGSAWELIDYADVENYQKWNKSERSILTFIQQTKAMMNKRKAINAIDFKLPNYQDFLQIICAGLNPSKSALFILDKDAMHVLWGTTYLSQLPSLLEFAEKSYAFPVTGRHKFDNLEVLLDLANMHKWSTITLLIRQAYQYNKKFVRLENNQASLQILLLKAIKAKQTVVIASLVQAGVDISSPLLTSIDRHKIELAQPIMTNLREESQHKAWDVPSTYPRTSLFDIAAITHYWSNPEPHQGYSLLDIAALDDHWDAVNIMLSVAKHLGQIINPIIALNAAIRADQKRYLPALISSCSSLATELAEETASALQLQAQKNNWETINLFLDGLLKFYPQSLHQHTLAPYKSLLEHAIEHDKICAVTKLSSLGYSTKEILSLSARMGNWNIFDSSFEPSALQHVELLNYILHLAIIDEQDTIARKLLNAGASLEQARLFDLNDELLNSIQRDDLQAVETAFFCRDFNNDALLNRALQIAIEHAQTSIIIFLLNHGVNPNQLSNGMTPLTLAAQLGHINTIRILLEHDVDLDRPTADKKTAIELAEEAGHFDIIDLILRKKLALYISQLAARPQDNYKTKIPQQFIHLFSNAALFLKGYSSTQKLAAATLLQVVMAGEEPAVKLLEYDGELTNGQLSKIYKRWVSYQKLRNEQEEYVDVALLALTAQLKR